jgi:hypothetical protein
LCNSINIEELPIDFINRNKTVFSSLLDIVSNNEGNREERWMKFIDTCKLLRLIVVRCNFSDQIRESGLLSCLINTLIDHLIPMFEKEEEIANESQYINLISIIWNVILNSVTQNVTNLHFFLSHSPLGLDIFSRSIDLFFHHRRVIHMIIMTLYNGMVLDSTLQEQIINNQKLLMLLLEAYSTGRTKGTDNASEWILLLWSNLLKNLHNLDPLSDKLSQIAKQLLMKKKRKSTLHLTEILYICTKEKTIERNDLDISISDSEAADLNIISNAVLTIAKSIFYKVAPFDYSSIVAKNIIKEDGYLIYKELETLFICLEILANTTAMDHELIRHVMTSQQLVQFSLDLLKKCPPYVRDTPRNKTSDIIYKEPFIEVQVEGSDISILLSREILEQTGIPVRYDKKDSKKLDNFDILPEQTMFFGYRTLILRILGNMCYNSKENQNLVRNLDGIPLVLNHCYTDDRNPYLREWGVFCVRNLTEENLENQELISKYQALQIAPESQSLLNDLGVQAEIENSSNNLISMLKFTRANKK